MSPIDLLDITILLLCTLVMSSALNKWLQHRVPVMGKAVWYILLPSYVCIILFGVVGLLTSNHYLTILRDLALTLFIYVGILFGVLLICLELKNRKKFGMTEEAAPRS